MHTGPDSVQAPTDPGYHHKCSTSEAISHAGLHGCSLYVCKVPQVKVSTAHTSAGWWPSLWAQQKSDLHSTLAAGAACQAAYQACGYTMRCLAAMCRVKPQLVSGIFVQQAAVCLTAATASVCGPALGSWCSRVRLWKVKMAATLLAGCCILTALLW